MSAELFRNAGAVFGPAEIDNLAEAYERALSSIAEDSVKLEVPGHQLRRELASRIIEEARRGQSDPKLLAECALAALAS